MLVSLFMRLTGCGPSETLGLRPKPSGRRGKPVACVPYRASIGFCGINGGLLASQVTATYSSVLLTPFRARFHVPAGRVSRPVHFHKSARQYVDARFIG
jgi:hypothetical protein